VTILKSALAGLLALRTAAILASIVLVRGIDCVSAFRSFPLLWVIPLAAFTLGFGWEYKYRKARQRRLK